MNELMDKLQQTVSFIDQKVKTRPEVAVILGSGLGNLTDHVEVDNEISYSEIPFFPVSTIKGHKGKLIFGRVGGKPVLVMSGRFHFYEGYTPQEVVYPIRVMKLLGIKTLLLSNASGCVNEAFHVGDLMIIKDHVSFFTHNPLIGPNEDGLGARFPDMSEPYSHRLITKAHEIAHQQGLDLKEGVYLGVSGPSFETRAEYLLVRKLGCDVVGMSTVQETIAAVHCGLEVFGVSVITDMGIRPDNVPVSHDEVLMAAAEAEPKLTLLFKELIRQL